MLYEVITDQLIDAALDNHPEDAMLEQARLQAYVVRAQAAVADGDLNVADEILRDGLRAYPGDVA